MKYYIFLLLISLLSSCTKPSGIEFNGNVPGVASGAFIIKDLKDSTIYDVKIQNGKFQIKRQLDHPGYYHMDISDDTNKTPHYSFDVYLEAGRYNIETEKGKLYKYPKITSLSIAQKQLSDYYTLTNTINSDTQLQIDILEKKLGDESLSEAAAHDLATRLFRFLKHERAGNSQAFEKYVEMYPKSTVAIHLINKLDHDQTPQLYFALFKKLDSSVKSSKDGKEMANELAHLMNIAPGDVAPIIVGTTTDGKRFTPGGINKKFILVDFWRSSNHHSRMSHRQLASNKNIAILSVSLDTNADKWKSAIKEDKLTGIQVSDLKGDDSPNVTNWAIDKVPTYYLLGDMWNVIGRDIDPKNIDLAISDYLKKHR